MIPGFVGKRHLIITDMAKQKTKADIFTRTWIIENSIKVISRYEDGVLTLRALHYQLVALGMTNTVQHYKRVVSAMIQARWDVIVKFSAFSDHDREVLGETDYLPSDLSTQIEKAENAISSWMNYYFKNRWENQPYYPEVWIEKKALQGVFEKPCQANNVALAPCKGYPSLTFLYEALQRFKAAEELDKKVIILYFGDYDASGEDIPRSIEENFIKFGLPIEVKRIALNEAQVLEMNLPPAPTKSSDSRAANWDGLGQVELDAVDIHVLRDMCSEAINEIFDEDLHDELNQSESEERVEYIKAIQQFVNDQSNEDGEDQE